jgi:phage shock protein A
MTATADLVELLRQWRDTTLEESQAIEQGRWEVVTACQAQKSNWMRDWPFAPMELAEAPAEVRALVEEIVALERRNYDHLTTNLENTRQQLEAIGQSRRQLRQLRRAYGTGQTSAWESWS